MRSLLLPIFGAALVLQPPQGVPTTAPHPLRRGGNPLDFMEVVWEINPLTYDELVPTIRITGANVQIVNAPLGTPEWTNGKGNLIIGRNTPSAIYLHPGSGSHNLIIGEGNYCGGAYNIVHGFSHVNVGEAGGALIGGKANTLNGDSCVVVGGSQNEAAANFSVVTGGYGNRAGTPTLYDPVPVGDYSVVSGGFQRFTGGTYDWAAGSLLEDL